MKKIRNILLVSLLVLVLSGCGKKVSKTDNKEKKVDAMEVGKKVLVNSFKIDYINKSFGLPIENNSEPVGKDGKTWYKVDTKEFKSIKDIEALIDKTYTSEKAKEAKKALNAKYMMIDGNIYTVSQSECVFEVNYKYADNIASQLLESAELSNNKITITVSGKKYELTNKNGNWLLSESVFTCE